MYGNAYMYDNAAYYYAYDWRRDGCVGAWVFLGWGVKNRKPTAERKKQE